MTTKLKTLLAPVLIDFEKLKEGHTLYSIMRGLVKVCAIRGKEYCIHTPDGHAFTKEGRWKSDADNPTLYLSNPLDHLAGIIEERDKEIERLKGDRFQINNDAINAMKGYLSLDERHDLVAHLRDIQKHYCTTPQETETREVSEWEKALVSLTPGGSEFAGDAERCVEWVRNFQEAQYKVGRNMTKEIKDLKARWDELSVNDLKWISVNERTPLATQSGNWDGLKSDEILVMDKYGKLYVAVMYEGIMDGNNFRDFFSTDDYEIDYVTHWMPLPELRLYTLDNGTTTTEMAVTPQPQQPEVFKCFREISIAGAVHFTEGKSYTLTESPDDRYFMQGDKDVIHSFAPEIFYSFFSKQPQHPDTRPVPEKIEWECIEDIWAWRKGIVYTPKENGRIYDADEAMSIAPQDNPTHFRKVQKEEGVVETAKKKIEIKTDEAGSFHMDAKGLDYVEVYGMLKTAILIHERNMIDHMIKNDTRPDEPF